MYHVIPSNQYAKSLKRVSQHKDFDVRKHKEVIRFLESDEKLAPQYKDHELKGEFIGIRECHVQNDILLLYRKEKDVLVLLLVDIGTHSYLFE
ncbi:MAG: Toxin-antitoxin system, toxin component, RelE family [Parcubacteria group bacterium GW2011_GWA1_47_8]|nr:MAG: Toxin-antitoxin system, toxin component, RelE family [Parcubacteria group bacterium GW2011_GWA1_47_8]